MKPKKIEYLKEQDIDDDYFKENVLIALETINANLILLIKKLVTKK